MVLVNQQVIVAWIVEKLFAFMMRFNSAGLFKVLSEARSKKFDTGIKNITKQQKEWAKSQPVLPALFEQIVQYRRNEDLPYIGFVFGTLNKTTRA